MPRQSKDKTQDIYFVFPRDYMQLYSLLSVNGDKVELMKLICKDFNVHPEYDLPYKLLSMIYSSDRCDCFESLKGDSKKGYDPLCFYRNGDGTWRDYLFQIPGICELLGIKRGFDIEKGYISRILSNSDNNSKGFLVEVFQIPILFLILVEQKISNGDFVPDEIIGLINSAIVSYTNKERNLFNEAQLQSCYEFFLNTSGNCAFRSWCVGRDLIAFEEMKIKVKNIVNEYIKNTNVETVKFKHSSEKGATISFPKYMRSIMLGIYERYDCLGIILPMVNKNTLWTNTDEMVLKNKEEKTARTFRAFQHYLYYRSEANKLLDSCETFMEEIGELQEIKYNACYVSIKEKVERINRLRDLSSNHLIVSDKMKKFRNKIEKNRKKVDKILEESYTSYYKTVEKKLTDYYTFCIYTLSKVLQEKEYKDIAQDAFERVFSIYLFNKETDLLYEKFEELYNKAKEEKDICSKVKLIKYIFNWISSNGMHAIYYSPGVYHRVRLAEYIFRTKLDMSLLESLYMDNIVYSENTLNDSVISEIADINQDYMIAEKEYIYKWISDQKELTKDDIINKDKLNEENASCKEYKEFYHAIYSKIDKVLNEKFQDGKYKKFGKVDASRIAKSMLGQMPIEKRVLHFWVILYSFLSEDSLIKVS